MSMTNEKASQELLIAVVRDATGPDAIRALAVRIEDWDGLIDLALRHCVLPMLFSRLAEMESALPASAAERISREYERIVVHNLANAAELIAVLEVFNRAGMQAMPFKGVALAASAYGDMLNRQSGDLDFLVRKSELPCATKLLRKRGYELETSVLQDGTPAEPRLHEYKFRRRADGRELELRWRLDLNWGRYGRDLGMEWVWPQHAKTVLAGAVVPILNPEISLLVLCMHGCKHYWSRLIWLCDIERVIDTNPALDWQAVLAEAKSQGLSRALGLGVMLSARLLQAKVPQPVLGQFGKDKTVYRLTKHFADNLVANPGTGPRARVPYGFQMLDFRDRLRFILSGAYLRPNERDRNAFGLPEWLSPLSFLLRPIRLLLDRSAR